MGESGPRLDPVIEAFARGYAFTRSFTHPYLAERVSRFWVVRDAPRRRAADYRREEWIAHGVEAAEVDRVARAQTRGRFAVCAIRAIDEPELLPRHPSTKAMKELQAQISNAKTEREAEKYRGQMLQLLGTNDRVLALCDYHGRWLRWATGDRPAVRAGAEGRSASALRPSVG